MTAIEMANLMRAAPRRCLIRACPPVTSPRARAASVVSVGRPAAAAQESPFGRSMNHPEYGRERRPKPEPDPFMEQLVRGHGRGYGGNRSADRGTLRALATWNACLSWITTFWLAGWWRIDGIETGTELTLVHSRLSNEESVTRPRGRLGRSAPEADAPILHDPRGVFKLMRQGARPQRRTIMMMWRSMMRRGRCALAVALGLLTAAVAWRLVAAASDDTYPTMAPVSQYLRREPV